MLCFEFVDLSMLCFSVLDVMCAQGVCNHGDTTNNDAEIANRMLHKMRESDDMFSSLTNFVTYERARVVSLMAEVEKVKKKTGAKLGEPWPSACAVPFVEDGNQKLRVAASTLPVPTAIGQQQSLDHASEFMVESASGGALTGSSAGGAGFRWRVKLNAIQERHTVAEEQLPSTPPPPPLLRNHIASCRVVCFRKKTTKRRASAAASPLRK